MRKTIYISNADRKTLRDVAFILKEINHGYWTADEIMDMADGKDIQCIGECTVSYEE